MSVASVKETPTPMLLQFTCTHTCHSAMQQFVVTCTWLTKKSEMMFHYIDATTVTPVSMETLQNNNIRSHKRMLSLVI